MAGLRVLIAEDEPISAQLMAALVEHEGHTVCGTIAFGSDVLNAVHDHAPDVVLMDVHLADGTSGIRATRDLVRSMKVPVIVISGTDSRDEQAEIAESGALGFIKKPVSADELRVNLRIATQHTEVMRKLYASEEFHRHIFDNAAVGIYVCHPEGRYLTSNHAFAHMLGYAGPAELLRLVTSLDDQVYVETNRRAELLQRLQQGDEIIEFESRVFGRDGDIIWVEEHLAPSFAADGRLQHYSGVVVNVTARKKAEAAMELAYSMVQNTVDAIADYIVVTDLEGNIIMANKSFAQAIACQLGTAGVFLPRQVHQTGMLSSAIQNETLFDSFLQDIIANPGVRHEKRGMMSVEGTNLILDTTISQYCTPDGETVGAVFVMRMANDTMIQTP